MAVMASSGKPVRSQPEQIVVDTLDYFEIVMLHRLVAIPWGVRVESAIWAENVKGAGVRFSFRVPRVP